MKNKTKTQKTGSAVKVEQNNIKSASLIKLGIDMHADQYTVVRQIDNGPLQPAQKMSEDKFFRWAQKQTLKAERVVTCYEAGTFGFAPARRLEEQGIKCLVMAPINLDENHTRVSNDRLDATRIASRLDRYLNGESGALNIVRIPTLEEEARRDLCRQRQDLCKESRRNSERGRAYLRRNGWRIQGKWWNGQLWGMLKQELPEVMSTYLQVWVDIIVALEKALADVHARLIAQANKRLEIQGIELPKGVGVLSYEVACSEVCNWGRFESRKNVGSMTGLCPGESSTGAARHQGPVTKHGNPRLRWILVEMAWRLVRYQPQYRAVKKRLHILRNRMSPKTMRKKAIVAVARQLGIDLWRVATGQTTFQKLGFNMPTPPKMD